jgi:hypothetical protein
MTGLPTSTLGSTLTGCDPAPAQVDRNSRVVGLKLRGVRRPERFVAGPHTLGRLSKRGIANRQPLGRTGSGIRQPLHVIGKSLGVA